MKNTLALILIYFSGNYLLGQSIDTIYINLANKSCNRANANKYIVWEMLDSSHYIVHKKSLHNHQVIEASHCSSINPFVREGTSYEYFDSSKIASVCTYKNDILQDTLTRFYSDGKLKKLEVYKDDTLQLEHEFYKSGKCYYTKQYRDGELKKADYYYESGELKRTEAFARNGEMKVFKCFTKLGADTPYYPALELPYFSSHKHANIYEVWENIKYYPKFDGERISGIVMLSFFVTPDNKVKNIEIVYSDHNEFNMQSLFLLGLTIKNWKAGYFEGIKETMNCTITIPFRPSH